jgi:RHS repeat-associated protein
MTMPGRNGSIGSKYRYGFQGQERDLQLSKENSYNFSLRMYDARLGRFAKQDPLMNFFPGMTPYSFAHNKVIEAYELEGGEPIFINGTWGVPHKVNPFEQKATANQVALRQGVKNSYNFKNVYTDEDELYAWVGANNTGARDIEVNNLVQHVVDIRSRAGFDPSDPIVLVGHSHGGIVALEAAVELRKKYPNVQIDVITINTANRKAEDGSYPDELILQDAYNINHYHVYTEDDNVVPYAGYNYTGKIYDPEVATDKSSGIKFNKQRKRQNKATPEGPPNPPGQITDWDKNKEKTGEAGQTKFTYDNGNTVNIPYNDQYQEEAGANIDEDTHDESYIERYITIQSAHRGWKILNVQQWIGPLQNAIRGNESKDDGDSPADPHTGGNTEITIG